jgi:hypothetical protein
MTEFNPLFDINVGPGGTFRKSGEVQTLPSHIDGLFEEIRNSAKSKVVMHFHGGLISERSGIKIARKMTPLYQSAGAYPINVIWETGFWETVTRNLDTIGKTGLFKKLVRYGLDQIRKRAGMDIGGRGGGSSLTEEEFERVWQTGTVLMTTSATGRGVAPALTEEQIDRATPQIETDLEMELQADAEFWHLMQNEAPFTETLDKSIIEEARGARGVINYAAIAIRLGKVVIRSLKRLVNNTDHGAYPTLVEELLHEFYLADLGTWIWTGMKDITEDMFKPNQGDLTADSYAGSYFLEHLAKLKADNPAMIIDLVGHSAGSIVICKLLKTIAQRHPELKPRNILFLAPAVISQIFHDELVTKPERFENFRMYTMSDDFESQDALFPPLYTRSLLYFISGALERKADTPVAGLTRHSTGESPYDDDHLVRIHEFLHEPGKVRLIQSITNDSALPGERTSSTSHGDFDDNPLTRESLAWVISA